MHSSAKHYSKIYNLQDQFLAWFAEQSTPFYLTGGTALGRFYLNHRYSEDLDFFVNHHSDFRKVVTQLIGIVTEEWNTDPGQTLRIRCALCARLGLSRPADRAAGREEEGQAGP
jgi:hypothetical protein